MAIDELSTNFAPAKRSSQVDIQRQHDSYANYNLLRKIANSVPDVVIILNENR